MNGNIYITVGALAEPEIFLQSTKLGFCEVGMPIFG